MADAQQRPLRLAIINQVSFHLHVVSGAMRVLRALSSAPVTVWVSTPVLKNCWGFCEAMAREPGFVWRDCAELDLATQGFDLVWWMSPEFESPGFDRAWVCAASRAAPPTTLQLLYLHKGAMPQQTLEQLAPLSSPGVPLLGMSPHVARYLNGRLQQQPGAADGPAAEWVLPTWPYQPPQAAADSSCDAPQGFCITGSLDPSLRNYEKVWQSIRDHAAQDGAASLAAFRLHILGNVVDGGFEVPDDMQQYVALHKALPDPEFYRVIHGSAGLLPALSCPSYTTSCLTSAAITTLMTGVPIVADDCFLTAYSMLSPETTWQQQAHERDLDVMFRVAQLPADEVAAKRRAVEALQRRMNERCEVLLVRWLERHGGGRRPDAGSEWARRGAAAATV